MLEMKKQLVEAFSEEEVLGWKRGNRLEMSMEKCLIARDWNEKEALGMMLETLLWRRENRVNEMLTLDAVPREVQNSIRRNHVGGMYFEW